MKQIDLREGARRQHRTLSLFAVVQCWIRALDGIAFQRKHLERVLGLTRFKRTRVDWLAEDLREFFPHQSIYWLTKRPDSLNGLIVSRIPVQRHIPTGSMKLQKRVEGIDSSGPRIGMFEIWRIPTPAAGAKAFESLVPFFADSANYDERFLSAYLALLAQGQISPHSLPPLKGEQTASSA